MPRSNRAQSSATRAHGLTTVSVCMLRRIEGSRPTWRFIVCTAVLFMIRHSAGCGTRLRKIRHAPRTVRGRVATCTAVGRSEAAGSDGGTHAGSALHCVPRRVYTGLPPRTCYECVSQPSPACLPASRGSATVMGRCACSRATTGSAHAGRTGRVLARVLFRGRCTRLCEILRGVTASVGVPGWIGVISGWSGVYVLLTSALCEQTVRLRTLRTVEYY